MSPMYMNNLPLIFSCYYVALAIPSTNVTITSLCIAYGFFYYYYRVLLQTLANIMWMLNKSFIKYLFAMQPQLHIPAYLLSTYKFSLPTKISSIEGNKILFQDTIFHPQGGGQPKDKGWVSFGGQKREILNAIANKDNGQIWYELDSAEGAKPGIEVLMEVDEETRRKNAKLHSAGHLIDLAVQNLGFGWETAKGYHFQDGPYVEYKGPNENLQQKATLLNSQLNKILSSHIPTVKQHYSYQEAVAKNLISPQFKTPLIRIIKFGTNSCPCGGTHIENTNEIKKLEISKLQKKGKFLRAGYVVQ